MARSIDFLDKNVILFLHVIFIQELAFVVGEPLNLELSISNDNSIKGRRTGL